jgi:predicted TPR repeat methyltransferase
MLDQAAGTRLYERLVCAELGDFLSGEDSAWDLAAAADVLVYFGDLTPLFAQVARALRPGGLFALSCEALEDAGIAVAADAGYVMLPSNRYAHGLAYIETCARAAGLEIIEMRREPLRREHGRDVSGHLLLLRRG